MGWSSGGLMQQRAAAGQRALLPQHGLPMANCSLCAFHHQVRSLQLHDRAMLAGSKLLVGSRFARAFVATYAVLLHLFIMVRSRAVCQLRRKGAARAARTRPCPFSCFALTRCGLAAPVRAGALVLRNGTRHGDGRSGNGSNSSNSSSAAERLVEHSEARWERARVCATSRARCVRAQLQDSSFQACQCCCGHIGSAMPL